MEINRDCLVLVLNSLKEKDKCNLRLVCKYFNKVYLQTISPDFYLGRCHQFLLDNYNIESNHIRRYAIRRMTVFPGNKTINQLSKAEKVSLTNVMIINGIKICKGNYFKFRKQGIFKRIGPNLKIIPKSYKDIFYYGRCFQFLLDSDTKNNTIASLLKLSPKELIIKAHKRWDWIMYKNKEFEVDCGEDDRCTWKDEVDNPSRIRCYCGNAKFLYYEDLETLEDPESNFLDHWECSGYPCLA